MREELGCCGYDDLGYKPPTTRPFRIRTSRLAGAGAFLPEVALRGAWRPAMGQERQYITVEDFRGFVIQANSSIKAVAEIARAHDLSDEEKNAVGTEINKVGGYTIPMAEIPKPTAVAQVCPAAPSPFPWWLAAAAGLVVGGLVGGLAV